MGYMVIPASLFTVSCLMLCTTTSAKRYQDMVRGFQKDSSDSDGQKKLSRDRDSTALSGISPGSDSDISSKSNSTSQNASAPANSELLRTIKMLIPLDIEKWNAFVAVRKKGTVGEGDIASAIPMVAYWISRLDPKVSISQADHLMLQLYLQKQREHWGQDNTYGSIIPEGDSANLSDKHAQVDKAHKMIKEAEDQIHQQIFEV